MNLELSNQHDKTVHADEDVAKGQHEEEDSDLLELEPLQAPCGRAPALSESCVGGLRCLKADA